MAITNNHEDSHSIYSQDKAIPGGSNSFGNKHHKEESEDLNNDENLPHDKPLKE